MSINTGLQIPYGIQPTNPLPVDAWSGPFIAESLNAGISAANSAIPIAFRFQSMEVRLIVGGESYKYWYAGGTGDGALVQFSAPGSPGPTGATPTDYVSSFNGVTGALQGVSSFNGLTGAVQGVSSFNGLTGAVQGVSSWNGLTGALQGVSSFNGLTGAVQGVSSFNGLTGAVQGVSNFNGLTGNIGITGGSNVTIEQSGSASTGYTYTINATLTGSGAATSSANVFTALQTFTAGISASGATFNGTVNIGTTALISAPSATALAIKSAVPAGTGVTPTVQVICPSAVFTLINQAATQPVFSAGMRTITLQAATTYMFEGQYLLSSTGTTQRITKMSFALTTATMTNCTWTAFISRVSSLNGPPTSVQAAIFDAVAGGNCETNPGTSNIQYTIIKFQGIARVNAAGTLVPNIAFSVAPGGTNTTLVGSYLKFYPIGANTIDIVGTAIT